MFQLSKTRFYAALLILGCAILLARTIVMINNGALSFLVLWAFILLIAELLTDFACLLSSLNWFISNDRNKDRLPLRLAAAVTILHAVRVLIFVLGRTGPWLNFDIRPGKEILHAAGWSWFGVYFAGIMSFISLIVLVVIWQIRRQRGLRFIHTETKPVL
jgi:hypothetical protein